MRVHTVRGDIVTLDNLYFSYWVFEILLKLQYHVPSLRLECVDVNTGKKVRLALMQLELDWQDVLTLNSGG